MNEEWKHRGTKIDHVKVDVELSILLESIHWECAEKNSNLCLPGLEQRVNCFREPLEIHWNLPLAFRHFPKWRHLKPTKMKQPLMALKANTLNPNDNWQIICDWFWKYTKHWIIDPSLILTIAVRLSSYQIQFLLRTDLLFEKLPKNFKPAYYPINPKRYM